ncbi:MAG: DUF1499 domain-containing protein [Blastomonas sp.]
MASNPGKTGRSGWWSRIILVLGIASVAVPLAAAIGAGQGYWSAFAGLGILRLVFLISLGVILLTLILLILYRKQGRGFMLPTLAGLVLMLGYTGYIGFHVVKAGSLPRIHDVSTDLADPPAFAELELRKDNLAEIPGRGDPEFAGMDARERWVHLHKGAYGDIRPVTVALPVADTVKLAEKLASERGWEIALADPEGGRLEATDTVALFRFKDDVVLRVRPGEAENTAVVDMRSVSRIGISDLGVNAKRVRGFLKDLQDRAGS